MMNSSRGFSRRNSIKRRAAAEAETKIKKLADDEANEVGKEVEAKRNPSKEMPGASSRPPPYQEKKRKGPTVPLLPLPSHREESRHASAITKTRHSNQSSASSCIFSSSLSLFSSSSSGNSADAGTVSSISGNSGDSEPENKDLRGASSEPDCCGDCCGGAVAAHNETNAEITTTLDEATDIDSAMKERIAHQRRRAKRLINSSGTMHLSRQSHHRIQKDRKRNPNDTGDDLSPIVARTLELTPVANIPTTPASRYRLSSTTATYVQALPVAASPFVTSSSIPKRALAGGRNKKPRPKAKPNT